MRRINLSHIMKQAAIYCVVILLALFGLNFNVRVGSGKDSCGILEELVFGGPAIGYLLPSRSDECKRWNSCAEASVSVIDLIRKHGADALTTSPALERECILAQSMSNLAYTNAIEIPREYLAASNPELPDMFFGYFVPAMDCFRQGFASGDLELVRKGGSQYDTFLLWIQSKKRSDFKRIR